ncbi:MAG: histidine phosphatase family protein [Actinomycetes bacterium]
MLLWRHGRTQWNDENRFQGHLDIPLDDVGRRQAELSADVLSTLHPDAVVSSDLQRARETAEALARRTGLVVAVDPALRETDGGTWQGRRVDELRAQDGEAYAAWRSGADVPAGGAETRSQLADRATAAVVRGLHGVPEAGLLVVATHGGTIRAVLGRTLGLPVDQWRVFGGLANACWSVLHEGADGWRLVEHNAGSLPQRVVGDDR